MGLFYEKAALAVNKSDFDNYLARFVGTKELPEILNRVDMCQYTSGSTVLTVLTWVGCGYEGGGTVCYGIDGEGDLLDYFKKKAHRLLLVGCDLDYYEHKDHISKRDTGAFMSCFSRRTDIRFSPAVEVSPLVREYLLYLGR